MLGPIGNRRAPSGKLEGVSAVPEPGPLRPPLVDAELPCPVERALEFVGDRWTARIVWRLMQGQARYGELRAALPGISPKTLTERLRRLEAAGALTRVVHAEAPPRVVYALTEHGRSLADIFAAMVAWGASHPRQAAGAAGAAGDVAAGPGSAR